MKRFRNIVSTSALVACLALPITNLRADEEASTHWVPGTIYILEGHANLVVYSIGEHRLLKAGSPVCLAALTIISEDSFVMETERILANGRHQYATKYGTITPSGRITFDYPDEREAIQIHVGVTAHGRGIVDGVTIYKGWFDEDTLYASFEVQGLQTTWPTNNPYKKDPNDPMVLYEGPISIYEDFDLVLVDVLMP